MHTNKHEFCSSINAISVHSRLVFGFGFAAPAEQGPAQSGFFLSRLVQMS